MPSHYLNQCWNIVYSNFGNKLHWNSMQNSYIFIQENFFENAICKMAAILSWPQCVNALYVHKLCDLKCPISVAKTRGWSVTELNSIPALWHSSHEDCIYVYAYDLYDMVCTSQIDVEYNITSKSSTKTKSMSLFLFYCWYHQLFCFLFFSLCIHICKIFYIKKGETNELDLYLQSVMDCSKINFWYQNDWND